MQLIRESFSGWDDTVWGLVLIGVLRLRIREARANAALRMTEVEDSSQWKIPAAWKRKQVPPLRFAAVGMTPRKKQVPEMTPIPG
jgi:hypothetical protein